MNSKNGLNNGVWSKSTLGTDSFDDIQVKKIQAESVTKVFKKY